MSRNSGFSHRGFIVTHYFLWASSSKLDISLYQLWISVSCHFFMILFCCWCEKRNRKEKLPKTNFQISLVTWIQLSIYLLFCKKIKKLSSVSVFKILQRWNQVQQLALVHETIVIFLVQSNWMLFKVNFLNFRLSGFFG